MINVLVLSPRPMAKGANPDSMKHIHSQMYFNGTTSARLFSLPSAGACLRETTVTQPAC